MLMTSSYRARDVIFVIIGVAALLFKSWFSDSLPDFAFSYLGNLSVSFAVYFLVRLASHHRFNMILSAIAAIVIVEVFEAANGFGIMTNVYDQLDYVANALGVALAVAVDVVSLKMFVSDLETPE
jgi:hypothetical protein